MDKDAASLDKVDQDRIVDGALRWALDHLGSADYPGLCYAFCEDAYELGADIILDGQGTTAKEAAEAYHPVLEGVPPRGSYVFYDCSGKLMGEYKNWGHMGLSLGDGRVVHSWCAEVRVDDFRAIGAFDPPPGWTQPVYTGWAPPAVFLKGMQAKIR